MDYANRRREAQAPVYTVTQPDTLLPFLLARVKGKSRNNVKSLLSRRLVAVDGVPLSRFDAPPPVYRRHFTIIYQRRVL